MLEPAQTAVAAPKMLIADDDPAVVRLLAKQCEKMGFAVETAANGMQLLIKARQMRPDILIVDVNMPELDGLSVCTHLLTPDSKPVEVVVVSGGSDPETAERCESLGTFFGRKGPDFWKQIEATLIEIFPHMAERIAGQTPAESDLRVNHRPRVLIIDDDPDVAKFLASRLDKFGVDALFAPDATQGFRIAAREIPSVIIADYMMPNGDAHYLLHRLRSTPATAAIPVFVLTGKVLSEPTTLMLKRSISGHPGAAQIFRKSFDTAELFGALQKFCGFARERKAGHV
jgi:CheY-like chemotaxis protein